MNHKNIPAALKAAGVRSQYNIDTFMRAMPVLEALGINNHNRLAVFIGQLCHESNGFAVLGENLNYSAKRLMQVWPSRFPNIKQAKQYARNPKALANKVYNGRMGNRAGTHDGWSYRGRGVIQMTGRNNYKLYGYEDNPDQLKDLYNGLVAAAEFFIENGLMSASDNLWHKIVCKRINGGLHGLKDRTKRTNKALAALSGGVVLEQFKLIKLGSRGKRVKLVQRALGVNDDGIFGNGTKRAVKKYQADSGLYPDGIIGENTYKSLLDD